MKDGRDQGKDRRIRVTFVGRFVGHHSTNYEITEEVYSRNYMRPYCKRVVAYMGSDLANTRFRLAQETSQQECNT